ncbi:MAG: DUF5017 domain-containing protein, partial [Bacteroidales bacterium]|nr:DUF5017 domain-containing protein [Bacteroidales bacterium]
DWDDATTPTGWTLQQSVSQEDTEIHSGTYSAKHTGGTNSLGQEIIVTPGQNYMLSFWYKVVENDGSDSRIWCVWRDDANDPLYDDTQAELRGPDGGYLSNGSGEWLQYSVAVTAPAEAAKLSLEVRTYSGAVTYWDDFVFEEYVDNDPPVWETTYPQAANVEDVQFDLLAQLDETSTVYYVVLDDGATAPSVAEVIAGTGNAGATAAVAGSFTAGMSETTETVTGLVVETSYDVYVVAEDDEATPNVQGAVSLVEITTVVVPDVLLKADFETDLSPFTAVSILGDQDWFRATYQETSYAKISGYSGGSAQDNDDYLISPAIDLDGSTDNTFSFLTAMSFSGPDLQVLISADFSGTYDATEVGNATWTDISSEFTYSGGSYAWVESGSFDLSAYSGTVYIAFRYLSNPTDGA